MNELPDPNKPDVKDELEREPKPNDDDPLEALDDPKLGKPVEVEDDDELKSEGAEPKPKLEPVLKLDEVKENGDELLWGWEKEVG